jgi:flagellar hook-associated protein 2
VSGITTGIGLISGIDTASLIEQLMQLEAAPVRTLQARVQQLDVQRTVFIGLSAKMLAVQNAGLRFASNTFFQSYQAASSDASTLTASASSTAVPGTYAFRVHSLATNHALVSRGMPDADVTPAGLSTLSIESAQGAIEPSTRLETLNGGEGVRRGVIRVTDRTGAAADVDLSFAVTVTDVLRAINTASEIDVNARVRDGSIVVEDRSGGDTSDLIIADRGEGTTARDLGIAGQSAEGVIEGQDLIHLTANTRLRVLNDGLGVGRLGALNPTGDIEFATTYGNFKVSLSDVLTANTDLRIVNSGKGARLDGVIRITDRSGKSADVDLSVLPDESGRATAQQVLDAINDADVGVSATIVNGHFQITDTTDTPEETAQALSIVDLSGAGAADLGIAQTVDETLLRGKDIYRVATLGDVVNVINRAADNNSLVRASVADDGRGLELEALGFENRVTVRGLTGSTAAEDLGIEGATFTEDGGVLRARDLIAGLNTVLLRSLNGGSGVTPGEVYFADRAGNEHRVDFSGVVSLQDVLDRINDETSLTASYNATGNGIVLRDNTGGEGPLIIRDVTGSLAADLHIAVSGPDEEPHNDDVVRSGNLQRQYVSSNTPLATLNDDQGVSTGRFRITDSRGLGFEVDLTSAAETVGDVIAEINRSRPGNFVDTFEARINDTGDGILLSDTSGGGATLSVEDLAGGRAATNLRIAGSADAGETFIDGSYETTVDFSASDTLEDVVEKINAAGGAATASLIRDPNREDPYSLVLTSRTSGTRGRLLIDDAGSGLGLGTLSVARDAIVSVGGTAEDPGLLIAAPSNTLDGVVEGVTINLLAPSEEEITLTVAQDVDSIVEGVRSFVTAFNDVQKDISSATRFNPETQQRGPLLGDSTVATLRSRLNRLMSRRYEGGGDEAAFLIHVGIRTGADNTLEFDEDRFRDAYAANPEAVEAFFQTPVGGFSDVMKETLESITRDFDGLIALRENALEDQKDLLNSRIDSLNELLVGKRARLEAQFRGLETALAGLQDQQTALNTLSALAAQFRS